MAPDNATTAHSSITPWEINWDDIKLPNNCEKCGAEYDCIDDAHESMCAICQDLFGQDEYSNTATGFDNTNTTTTATTPTVEPQIRPGEIPCSICRRRFRPSANTNGVSCTWCCNAAAANGVDVFTKYGFEMAAKARKKLDEFHELQRRNSQPSERVASSSIPTAADARTSPTKQMANNKPEASPATSRKRNVEESQGDDEDAFQDQHATKRSKSKLADAP